MQSAIQGITHNLPDFIRDPAIAIIGQECYTTLIYNADLSSKFCLRLAVSKGLGLGIVVFGSIMKIPQIMKIINSGSARGISFSMYCLEVVAYTISLAYAVRSKLPFSTYGENASLTLQNMIITLLIIAYSPTRTNVLTSSGSSIRTSSQLIPLVTTASLMVLGSLALFSSTLVPPHLLSFLQACTIPISLASKVPQMVELNRDKAPGQLSSIVVFAQLLGTIARVFTTLTETDDQLLFWGFSLATIFNLVIAIQLIMYWNGNEINARKDRSQLQDEKGSTSINMPSYSQSAARKPSGGSKLD